MENTLSEVLGRRNPCVVRATRKNVNRKSLVYSHLRKQLFAESTCSQSRPQVILNEPSDTEVQVVQRVWAITESRFDPAPITSFL
jgi:hypothetical protein